jgi:hypothetical protein
MVVDKDESAPATQSARPAMIAVLTPAPRRGLIAAYNQTSQMPYKNPNTTNQTIC